MKAVLISIQPKWCELIAAGYKTMELRKSIPKLEPPFKVYIYCTRPKFRRAEFARLSVRARYYIDLWAGKVIGEFVCDRIMHNCEMANADIAENQSFLRREKILEYSGGKEVYGWHISERKIYDKPKELTELYKPGTLSNGDFEYQLYDGSGDPSRSSYASYLFTRAIRKAPQSWCYVQEV